jgi:hypothetical protein
LGERLIPAVKAVSAGDVMEDDNAITGPVLIDAFTHGCDDA